MSLAVALPCAVLSAVAYGTSTAVQHRAAHRGTGRADARGVVRLLRDPRWLASVGGDTLGLVLQVVALATGPVLVVQPLLVLAVPVALPVGRLLGGPAPGWRDYVACGGILAALAAFFALVGDPGHARPLPAVEAAWAVVVAAVVGAVLMLAVRRASATARAAVYGAVAGAGFGLVGVLLDAVAGRWQRTGLSGFADPDGWVPLLALLLTGGVAPRWVKAGADWLLSDMLLFFVPAAVAVVQYGGLFKSDGWRLALVVVVGTLLVMVAVAYTVDQAVRLERVLAARRVAAMRRA